MRHFSPSRALSLCAISGYVCLLSFLLCSCPCWPPPDYFAPSPEQGQVLRGDDFEHQLKGSWDYRWLDAIQVLPARCSEYVNPNWRLAASALTSSLQCMCVNLRRKQSPLDTSSNPSGGHPRASFSAVQPLSFLAFIVTRGCKSPKTLQIMRASV
jgi:hypothetical protein